MENEVLLTIVQIKKKTMPTYKNICQKKHCLLGCNDSLLKKQQMIVINITLPKFGGQILQISKITETIWESQVSELE